LANQVDKVNGVAIASIEKVNGMTDANIQAFNSLEFTGVAPWGGLTWTAGADYTFVSSTGYTGTIAEGFMAGGYKPSSRTKVTTKYNGTSWSDHGDWDLNEASSNPSLSGSGTAALAFARAALTNPSLTTEKFDGTGWTNSADMVRAHRGGTGTTDANAIQDAGDNDATNQVWNDVAWSNAGECNQNTHLHKHAGSSTDAIKWSGYSYDAGWDFFGAETLDSTTWTEITNCLNDAAYGASWGDGSTFAVGYGGINYNSPYGSPTPHVVNRSANRWDGSAWSVENQAPDAGGTLGGLYNGTFPVATIGNSASEGAVYHAGYTYTAADTHTKVQTTFHATWD
jgi:hypothetical protein